MKLAGLPKGLNCNPAKAVVALMQSGFSSQPFNVSSGSGITLNALIGAIEAAAGEKEQVEYKPGQRQDVPRVILCNRRLIEKTGWAPQTGLADGLRLTAEWLRGILTKSFLPDESFF